LPEREGEDELHVKKLGCGWCEYFDSLDGGPKQKEFWIIVFLFPFGSSLLISISSAAYLAVFF
jgi:hypothetical protein